MIEAVFENLYYKEGLRYKEENGTRGIGFTIKGHADYSEKGSDIVCAAVSALSQSAVITADMMIKASFDVRIENGFISFRAEPCKLPAGEERTLLAILNVLCTGLIETAAQYEGRIKVEFI